MKEMLKLMLTILIKMNSNPQSLMEQEGMASRCARAGSDWTLGRISSQGGGALEQAARDVV